MSQLYFGKEFYMFRIDLLPIITSMTNTNCCEYSVKNPDNVQ